MFQSCCRRIGLVEQVRLVEQVDGAAALGGATTTDYALLILGKMVVERKLVALLNILNRKVQDATADDARFRIGIAGVIYEFSPAAAFGTVQIPVGINREEAMNRGRL